MLATFRIGGVVESSTSKFGGPDEEWGFSGIWGTFWTHSTKMGRTLDSNQSLGSWACATPG